MIKFLDLYNQYLSIQKEIDQAIKDVIEQSAYIGGKCVKNFEDAFASYQQADFCVCVGNGTDALEIALEALSFPAQSEIIVPANSFISSSEAVTRCGHKVVFADVDTINYTIDLKDVEKRISQKTKAIIAVHLYGHPCDMDGLKSIANKYNLKIIEDCAQAHGAEYKGRRLGAIGDIGTFSFYPGKNLGAYGDGGAIITNHKDMEKRCRMIANHGRIEKYNHLIEGRNSRLDGLQAAILGVKLKYLDGWIDQRNKIAVRYQRGLRDVSEVFLPSVMNEVRHAYHLFVIRVKKRDELKIYLENNNIETGIHYPIALPKLNAYKYLNQSDEPMLANNIDTELLSLPIGEHLCYDDIDKVVYAIRKFYSNI
jgi:dTDP-4-amino-4,6-dideoxygalactose transaminase